MKSVTTYLVVVFDASGNPAETHWCPTPEEAKEKVKECKDFGCDWVKKFTITSPPVPYGDSI
ncbi:MAG TPA: hypothetical protein VD973_09440 [Symbiobacteriaceae bacterium]|nr:hypothetical protein [Symbiobacteriaceae bacterium]